MSVERYPDGSLRFNAHVPLWTSLVVMALFFAFAGVFSYSALFDVAGSVRYRGMGLDVSVDPWVWQLLFLLGAIGMLAPGVFILLGLLRGGTPNVMLDDTTIRLSGRPMASDVTLRWDNIVSVQRSRIQGFPAIRLKTQTGKDIQLTAHIFPEKGDFEALCREIEFRTVRKGKPTG